MIPIMRLPGGSRAAPKQVQKWPERAGREDWLGGFMMVSRSGQGDGCACSLNFPQVSRQEGVRLFFFFLIIICFIYLFSFGCAGSSLLCWLFCSCGERGLLSSCSVWLLIAVASRCVARALGYTGFRSCCTWAQQLQLQGPRAQAQ